MANSLFGDILDEPKLHAAYTKFLRLQRDVEALHRSDEFPTFSYDGTREYFGALRRSSVGIELLQSLQELIETRVGALALLVGQLRDETIGDSSPARDVAVGSVDLGLVALSPTWVLAHLREDTLLRFHLVVNNALDGRRDLPGNDFGRITDLVVGQTIGAFNHPDIRCIDFQPELGASEGTSGDPQIIIQDGLHRLAAMLLSGEDRFYTRLTISPLAEPSSQMLGFARKAMRSRIIAPDAGYYLADVNKHSTQRDIVAHEKLRIPPISNKSLLL